MIWISEFFIAFLAEVDGQNLSGKLGCWGLQELGGSIGHIQCLVVVLSMETLCWNAEQR